MENRNASMLMIISFDLCEKMPVRSVRGIRSATSQGINKHLAAIHIYHREVI
jgi:hypothetical protein